MQCKPLSRYADADDGRIGDREQGGIMDVLKVVLMARELLQKHKK
jgi:hypothetical protein